MLQGLILKHVMWHTTTYKNITLIVKAQTLRMSSPLETFLIGFQACGYQPGSLWSDVKQQTFPSEALIHVSSLHRLIEPNV